MTKYSAFFGDGEKTFAFPTRELIEELERKAACGIGGLFARFRTSTYSLADVLEVLRIGLIGGGTSPAEAAQLIAVYGVGRPLAEVFTVADGVISALYFGPEDETADDEPEDEMPTVVARAYADVADMENEASAINDALQQVAE